MIKDSYDIKYSPDKLTYVFQSEGNMGTIWKGIVFTQIEDNIWNLAFGDIVDNDINDSVVSNNYDFVKLFGTIAKAVYLFSAQYPQRMIYIEPYDDKRKRLYNHIFRRNYKDIGIIFHIRGILSTKIEEDYSPEIIYDYFRLTRKFVQ